MVGTRSGIETNPAPATQEEDVPRQIEVTSMEQEEEIPSTNPVSGLQLPISNLQTPVGRPDIYILQGQTAGHQELYQSKEWWL